MIVVIDFKTVNTAGSVWSKENNSSFTYMQRLQMQASTTSYSTCSGSTDLTWLFD